MKPENNGARPASTPERKVEPYTAYLAMLDFIDNVMPGLNSVVEVKAALVVWRKTHGFQKLSESMGSRELAKRIDTDAKTLRRAGAKGAALAEKIGIIAEQEIEAPGDLSRTRYTWPINDRVQAVLGRGEETKAARRTAVEGWGRNEGDGWGTICPHSISYF